MKAIQSLLTYHSFLHFVIYIMDPIIKQAYETNFGTAYETYKQVVKEHPNIRLQGVKHYLSKLESVQVKFEPRGSNSFVSPGAKFEYEVDVMDVLARYGVGIICGFVAVDNFTNVLEVMPTKNRQPAEMIRALT